MKSRNYFLLLALISCQPESKVEEVNSNSVFNRMPAEETGLFFENKLELQEDFDVFRYRNYYNGGGVGIGDINNDGLADVYLTSNMGDNKLFLNKGNWKFEDITAKAGVAGTKVWSTGVAMADVNGDGLLDIYVCNSGDPKGSSRENELFINNGDLTFTDKAKEFGLDDKGFSTHAVFFDYDKDGDLDCYILNNSFRAISSLGYRNLRHERDPLGGHRLYNNDEGKFIDVSEHAGIYGSVIGFGLGITAGDVNGDNWPDLYISNDFYERDYLYINNHDGTFSEKLEECMSHISMFSMGADLADLNNDGFPEIFSTDMLPEDNYRLKTMTAFEGFDVYQLRLRNGYYHQFMRNMLQVNNGDGTFTEIGELAGVAATDWSWGALISDFDNDTRKEIFVCNGIYKDVTNQDFVDFLGSSEQLQAAIEGKKINFQDFIDRMPSQKLSNYLFVQQGTWKYKNQSKEWGLDEPSFSNGAAYGDLDNDGDLDLIVSNVNQELFTYRNQTSDQGKGNFLSLNFKGEGKNSFGVGALVKLYVGNELLYYEQMPMRGFQSSMDYKMLVGVGNAKVVDSLIVIWPNDKVEVLKGLTVNNQVLLDQKNAVQPFFKDDTEPSSKFLEEVKVSGPVHTENQYNDFDRDRLLYHMLSTQGPAVAVADFNADGLDDFYLGGSAENKGALYIQKANLEFEKVSIVAEEDALSDDTDAVFFDADNDGDLDLYVVSGGSELTSQSPSLIDRLYENKGRVKGKIVFEKSIEKLPRIYSSGSCVRPVDFDQDGDQDLFIGTRVLPSYYGIPGDQYLLQNDGNGNFTDISATAAPEFAKLGMVTDAQWFDYDQNGFKDLIVVGDWMPVQVFLNDGKKIVLQKEMAGLEKSNGWWNRIYTSDIDHDGDADFILGNIGTNSKFKPSKDSPVTLYVNDFDKNGSVEPVFSSWNNGKEYPMTFRQDMIKQMSSFKKQFVYYKDYAGKGVSDIFDAKLLAGSTILKFYEASSSVMLNNGKAGFQLVPLPVEAQTAPVYGIEMMDLNSDGHDDLLLGGNLFAVKPEVGRYDGLTSLILTGDGKGKFSPIKKVLSGVEMSGEVRAVKRIKSNRREVVAWFRNNDSVKFYSTKKK